MLLLVTLDWWLRSRLVVGVRPYDADGPDLFGAPICVHLLRQPPIRSVLLYDLSV